MRLGLSSIVGDGFGTGSFGVDGALTPPSFPPAGSYNSTLFGETYPVAFGGTDFSNPVTSASVPNQICDVEVLNDGSGGTYINWGSATNIQFKAYGVEFYNDVGLALNIEVPVGSGSMYQGGTYDNQYIHDGAGYYTSQSINQSYYSSGSDTNIYVLDSPYTTEVPSGSSNYIANGLFDGYTWDGSGGYNYPVGKGSYYSYGTYIYNDGSFDYYWDGSGGYYI